MVHTIFTLPSSSRRQGEIPKSAASMKQRLTKTIDRLAALQRYKSQHTPAMQTAYHYTTI